MKWEWKGEPLAPPLTIARRLSSLPLIALGHALTFLGLIAGYGSKDARYWWRHRNDV